MNKISISVLLLFFCFSAALFSQTPGLIFDPSTGGGPAILDPNSDGWTSATAAGFLANDESESELPFSPMIFPMPEPDSDLGPGPDCGFTDFVQQAVGVEDAGQYYFDPSNNWIFRLRMGKSLPNSKSYSILIDTDQKFGSSGPNADPDYVIGNPGFEIEIVLATNFGVYVYDIRGSATATEASSYLGHTNYQKSIALSNECGDPDYFYDFFVPFGDLTADFGITTATPLRMVLIDNMAANKSSIEQTSSRSDLGGMDDCGGNFDACLDEIIDNYTPCAPTGSCPDRTTCPSITGPIAVGATTVSGTTSHPNGTIIKIFKQNRPGTSYAQIGSDFSVIATPNWSVTVPPLVASDSVYATATAPGLGESINNCDLTIVAATCSAPPTSSGSCNSDKSFQGVGVPGAVIRVYYEASTTPLTPTAGYNFAASTVTVGTLPSTLNPTTDNWLWKCSGTGQTTNCASGSGCLPDGQYRVTQQEPGKCESEPLFICRGVIGTSTAPVITSPVISSSTSVSGTCVSSASTGILLYADGVQIGAVTVSGTTNWTISSLTLTVGQVLTAKSTESTKCISAVSNSAIVIAPSQKPTILGTYCVAVSVTPPDSIYGTSLDPTGTFVVLFKNGARFTPNVTATVRSNGTWGISSGSWSFVPADVITAYDSVSGGPLSPVSNPVTVGNKTLNAVAISTVTITEGDASVSGTGTDGDVIRLYIDGIQIGSSPTVAGGVWTVSGIGVYDLYPTGIVIATAASPGKCESTPSASKIVACNLPSTTLNVDPASETVCSGSIVANIQVYSSQSGVIYQLYNNNLGANSGTSKLGNGGTITLNSSVLTANTTISVLAIKIPVGTCSSTLVDNVPVTVNAVPTLSLTVAASNNPICENTSTNITVATSEVGFSYQLRDNADDSNVGSAVAGTGGTINLPTGNLTADKTFNVYVVGVAPSNCSGELTATQSITVTAAPAAPTGSAAQTFCNSATVAGLTATGSSIQWYAASSGGSALAGTTSLVNATSYFASQTVSGCESVARFEVAVTINAPAAPTGTAAQTFCNSGTVADLAATGTSIQWYAASSGGSALAGTIALVNGTSYFASQTISGCESATRFEVVVTINAPAAPTGTAAQTFCNSGTVADLTATGSSIQWYAASSGGAPLAGTTALVDGTSYFASQTVSGCESATRFEVVVTINAPVAPTGSASQAFCDAGTVADLTATGTSIQWYAASSGGSALAGTTALVNGTSYFASQTVSGCESASRFEVVVTINSTPAAPTGSAAQTFCNSGTVADLTATGTSIQWYAASSGGAALAGTAALADGNSYFASQTVSGCESSSRFEVVVTINAPAAPTGSAAQSFCNSGTVADLAATGTSIQWYAASSGGVALAGTTALVNGTSYFASQMVSGCESATRFEVVVTINAPAAPTGSAAQTFCNSGTVADLTATGTSIQWYAASSGGVALAGTTALVNGNSYFASQTVSGCESATRFEVVVTINAPAAPTGSAIQTFCNSGTVADLAATGTSIQWYATSSGGAALAGTTALVDGSSYFASQTVSGCESANRLEVVVTINVPAAPTGSAAQSFCNSGTVADLTATGTSIQWYAASSGGAALAGTTALANGTSYFATQTISGCESATRFEVVVTINALPTPGFTAAPTPVCVNSTGNVYTTQSGMAGYIWSISGGTITSGGTATDNSATVTWISSGSQSISVNYTDGNGCTAASATSQTVTVNALPVLSVTVSPNDTACVGTSITLSGVGASSYIWDNGVTDSVAFTASASTTYSVTGTDGNGCSDTISQFIKINNLPVVTISGTDTICAGDSTLLTATGGGSHQWYLNGVVISGATANTYYASLDGIYNDIKTNTNGCSDSAAAGKTVVVNALPAPGFTAAPTPVCLNSTGNVYTTQNGMTGYVWSISGGTITSGGTATDNSATVTWTSTGSQSISVNYTYGNGCTAASATSQSVSVTDLPVAPTGSSPQSFCDSATVADLNVTGTAIQWYAVSSGGSPLALSTSLVNGNSYYASQTISGCESSGRLQVDITINSSTSSTLNETACDSFTLNSTTYNSGGTYTQMLTNAAGCDSAITLNLTINQSTSSTLNQTACDSFTLNSTTYNASGTYTQTLTNAAGCDSTLTLNLTINQSTSSTLNETSCDSYTLNSTTYNASGTYTQTLTNSDGCDSTITLNLTIIQSETSAAGTNQNLSCASITTTLLANTPSSGTGTWSLITGTGLITDVNDPNSGVTGLTPGTNTFRWTISNPPCADSFDEVNINVVCVNLPPDAQNDIIIIPEDSSISINVQSNDSDPNGDSLITSIVSNPSNGIAVLNGNNVDYNPNPDFNGNDTIVYAICDTVTPALCDTAIVIITVTPVNDKPEITDSLGNPVDTIYEITDEDTPLMICLDAVDIDGDDVDVTGVASGPSNGTITGLSDGDTCFTYTPDPDYFGNDTVEIILCNNGLPSLCDTALVIITVNPVNDPPVAANDSITISEDAPATSIDVQINDSDIEGNSLTTSIVSGPANGTASLNGNNIDYTPNSNFNGNDTILYAICDDGIPSLCDTAFVFIVVNAVNDPPVAVNDSITISEDATTTNINVQINDSDLEGNALTTSIVSGPLNGTAALNGNNINYTPNADFNGNDTIVYAICDDGIPSLCDTAIVIIMLTPVNDPPDAVTDNVSTNEETPVTIDVQLNDNDVDGDPLTTTVVVTSSNGTVSILNGDSLIYTPDLDFSGADTIIYKICDNGIPPLCDEDTVFVTVINVNDPPIALDDVSTTDPLVADTINVILNDSDPDGDLLSISIVTQPDSGTATVLGNGEIIYITNGTFINGIDTVVYEVCDNGSPQLCDTAIVVIYVPKSSLPPMANDDFATVPEDQNVTLTVLANDADPNIPGDTLTVTILNSPVNGTASVTSGNEVFYSPNTDFNGLDSLVYVVCDTASFCDTATVYITVIPSNDGPDAVTDFISTDVNTLVIVDVQNNDTDPDGDGLATSVIIPPANGTVSVLSGDSVVYAPDNNYFGNDYFVYEICDAGIPTLCDADTVFITINSNNNPPDAVTDLVSVNEDSSINIDVQNNDSDPDGNTLVTTILSGPNNGSASVLNGDSISYSPNTNFNGTDTIFYQICDNGVPVLCDADTVFITISSVNDAPVAVDDTVTMNENITVSVDVQNNDSDVDGNSLTTSIVSMPVNGTVSLNGNNIDYSPNTNFTGNDTIIYAICDNGIPSLCDTAYVFITVVSVNDPPVAVDDITSTDPAVPVTVDVLLNDSDPEGDLLSVNIIGGPSNGIVINNGEGTITYTSNITFTSGIDTVFYLLCDNGIPFLCDTGLMIIYVPTTNFPPVAVDDSVTMPEDSSITIDVLANDSDPDGDSLSVTIISGPSSGISSVNASGEIDYSPNSNYSGNDTIIYQVCDDGIPVMCDTAIVIITITPVNDKPNVPDTTVTTPEDSTITFCLNISDVDAAQTYTVLSCGNAANGTSTTTVTGNQVCITYTPNADFNGLDSLCVLVCDDGTPSLCDTAIINIIVTPVNDKPTVPDTTVTTPEDSSITFCLNISDVDAGQTYTVLSCGNAANGTSTTTVTGNQVCITYTPNADFNGLDSLCIVVCDDGTPSLCDTAIINVVVTPVSDTTYSTINQTACDSFALNSQTYTSSGTYTQSLTNSEGGDSIITLNLTINQSTGSILTQMACDSFTLNSQTYTASGTYSQTLTNVAGCDSTITLNLIINQSTSSTLSQTACDSFTLNSQTYTASGTYSQTLTNVAGCDSVITLNLTITSCNNPPSAPDTSGTTPEETPIMICTTISDDASSIFSATLCGVENGEASVSVNGNQLCITYTPGLNFVGTADVCVVVCDNGNPILCDTVHFTITVTPVNLEIPQGFSPNGDGVNDYFVIPGLENYPDNGILIFNRWGNLIYEAHPYKNDWNGTYEGNMSIGNELPAGTYFFVLTLDANSDPIKKYLYLSR